MGNARSLRGDRHPSGGPPLAKVEPAMTEQVKRPTPDASWTNCSARPTRSCAGWRRRAARTIRARRQSRPRSSTRPGSSWPLARRSATSRLHFKRIAARAMRQVLVEAARRRQARKRGGGGVAVRDLRRFARRSRGATPTKWSRSTRRSSRSRVCTRGRPQMVESRFFGGLDVAETAELLASRRPRCCATGARRRRGWPRNCDARADQDREARMDPARCERIQALFHEAVDLPVDRQRESRDARCGGRHGAGGRQCSRCSTRTGARHRARRRRRVGGARPAQRARAALGRDSVRIGWSASSAKAGWASCISRERTDLGHARRSRSCATPGCPRAPRAVRDRAADAGPAESSLDRAALRRRHRCRTARRGSSWSTSTASR